MAKVAVARLVKVGVMSCVVLLEERWGGVGRWGGVVGRWVGWCCWEVGGVVLLGGGWGGVVEKGVK